jgi:hypothetical protein
MSTELYIPPTPRLKSTTDPKTGRFLPGHVPFNKDKKWADFKTKKGQRNSAKGWKNCEIGHAKGHPAVEGSGRPKKPVVAITEDGAIHAFSFIGAAALWCGGNRENVRRCCCENHSRKPLHKAWDKHKGLEPTKAPNTDHRYMGIRFYFESDFQIYQSKIVNQ